MLGVVHSVKELNGVQENCQITKMADEDLNPFILCSNI